jgi:multicomponent Na+:H+ antiporter subunit G
MIGIASESLLWISGILALIGTAGILRFPDFYTRCHAATIVSIGGFTLALVAIAINNPFGIYSIKIFMVIAVNLMANPTTTHALADSAYKIGIKPAHMVRDDLSPKGGARK